VDPVKDIPYLAVAYVFGIAGLTRAYAAVSYWLVTERMKAKLACGGWEKIWFTLFYNNSFYVFLLFLGSQLIFSTFHPSTSLILTQALAVLLPAWMPSLSKKKSN
jgi:hypothetical protein